MAVSLVAVTVKPVGASGGAVGVAITVSDGAPSPSSFTARTWKV